MDTTKLSINKNNLPRIVYPKENNTVKSLSSPQKQPTGMKKFDKDYFKRSKYLKFIHKYLDAHYLWSFKANYVAMGAAIGVFWSLIFPVGQIALTALTCFILRGNLMVGAITTLPSNPITYPFILYFYNWLGLTLFPENVFNFYGSSIVVGGMIATTVITVFTFFVAGLISIGVSKWSARKRSQLNK